MVAVGESLENCDTLFDELILITRQFISFSLLTVEGLYLFFLFILFRDFLTHIILLYP